MSSQVTTKNTLESTPPPRSNWSTVIVITMVFVGIYFVLRNIPNTQCDVLHYEVTQETANGIEMCADGPSGMMDLNRVKFPGELRVFSEPVVSEGVPYQGVFSIKGPKGDELLPHEVAITHAEKIHLIAVDRTLNDYHHLHPKPIDVSGRWQYEFTPRTSGTYDIYVECVPLRTRKQLILHTTLEVETEDEDTESASKPIGVHEELNLEWDFSETSIREGSWVHFTLTLSHPDGSPIPLQKVMDAYSHVVAFREGTTGYAHIHPTELEQTPDPVSPTFSFTFYSGEKGAYRFWAQFQVDGKSIFIPHDVEVF